MTYEVDRSGQAEMEKFSRSTFSERKIMSTKTSIKRIAAVAAVALTLGGFSAVSAHAGTQADSFTSATTASTTTSGVAATLPLVVDYLAGSSGDTTTVSSTILTLPAYSTTPSAVTFAATTGPTQLNNTATTSPTTSATNAGRVTRYVTASFTPDVAGTYTIALKLLGGINLQTIVWTVTATAPAGANTSSKLWLANNTNSGSGAVNGVVASCSFAGGSKVASSICSHLYETQRPQTQAQADATLDASTDFNAKSISIATSTASLGTTVASIGVWERNNSAALDTTIAAPITATITGPGYVAIGTGALVAKSVTEAQGTAGVDGYGFISKSVYIISDGTTGTSTITISAGGVTLGTKTIVFYGTPAKVTATANTAVLSTSGTSYLGDVELYIQDANGVPVAGTPGTDFDITASTSDATVVSKTIAGCAADALTGTGYYTCDVNAVAGVASGKSASLTFNVLKHASTTVLATSSAVSFTTGGNVINGLKLAPASSTYNPGDKVTLNLTATDADGNPVADGVYNVFNTAASTTAYAGMTTSAQVTSAIFAATAAVTSPAAANAGGITFTGGLATAKFYAPYTSAPLTIAGTTSGSSASLSTTMKALGYGTAVSTVVTIANPTDTASQAAVDAANEATDAANAATDAANNAMDSADAAQQAALDAGDKADAALAAVTDLATKVSAIATQIAALSALVKKIAAKVKA
jgi:hypothetical protein